MLWLKRNLFFSVSLLVILGFFGYGCFYLYSKWDESGTIQKSLEETDANLKKIYDSSGVFPSKTNIDIIKVQAEQLKSFVADATKIKARVEFDARITPSNFKTLLDNSLADLNKQAEQARIPVAQRDFSFSAIKPLVSFPEGSVGFLAEELADVKALCGILFRSEITSLDNLRRVPVCKPDLDAGGSLDYHTLTGRTNEITGDAVSVYLVTFQGFSESLASVLDNLQRSPYGFSVHLLSVLPGSPMKAPAAPAPQPFGQGAANTAPPLTRNAPVQAGRAPAGPTGAQGVRRLETLADEKAFKVAMIIEIAKPLVAAK
ncbi:MAG TPA: hypothetical protein DCM86_01070 [Verrucomicrobiales bacterium]|nr:hypothetical protein [Verrucomicrobiales bacterium]